MGTLVVTDPEASQTHRCVVVGSSPPLRIDGLDIVVAKPLDHETYGRFLKLQVRCEDDGAPPRSLTSTIEVAITNVDEPPVAVALAGASSIFTNTTVGTAVGVLQCHDADSPQRVVSSKDGYRVEILPGESAGLFRVDTSDQSSGVIMLRTAAPFLVARPKILSLGVRCTDPAGLFVDANVSIAVIPSEPTKTTTTTNPHSPPPATPTDDSTTPLDGNADGVQVSGSPGRGGPSMYPVSAPPSGSNNRGNTAQSESPDAPNTAGMATITAIGVAIGAVVLLIGSCLFFVFFAKRQQKMHARRNRQIRFQQAVAISAEVGPEHFGAQTNFSGAPRGPGGGNNVPVAVELGSIVMDSDVAGDLEKGDGASVPIAATAEIDANSVKLHSNPLRPPTRCAPIKEAATTSSYHGSGDGDGRRSIGSVDSFDSNYEGKAVGSEHGAVDAVKEEQQEEQEQDQEREDGVGQSNDSETVPPPSGLQLATPEIEL